jgi:hypothetical protein
VLSAHIIRRSALRHAWPHVLTPEPFCGRLRGWIAAAVAGLAIAAVLKVLRDEGHALPVHDGLKVRHCGARIVATCVVESPAGYPHPVRPTGSGPTGPGVTTGYTWQAVRRPDRVIDDGVRLGEGI